MFYNDARFIILHYMFTYDILFRFKIKFLNNIEQQLFFI